MLLQSYFTPARRYVRSYAEDPFSVIERALYRSASSTEKTAMAIRLDVKEDEKSYHVTADLPGLAENEVELTYEDNVLTLKGEKKVERSENAKDENKVTWHITERTSGSFVRTLSLPDNVDAEKIEAKFDKGVLSVTLPKLPAEQTATKKISIKAG